jgi:hypothetical protein
MNASGAMLSAGRGAAETLAEGKPAEISVSVAAQSAVLNLFMIGLLQGGFCFPLHLNVAPAG